jgi:ABC-type bacteriocin/lantibiotic exporter with double-glycine peptidase domain
VSDISLLQFEVNANGIERINDYLRIDQEPAPTDLGTPPASWPMTGEIRVENLKARYFEGGPVVLDNLSFEVPAGSRIGIVGRTGSGVGIWLFRLVHCVK